MGKKRKKDAQNCDEAEEAPETPEFLTVRNYDYLIVLQIGESIVLQCPSVVKIKLITGSVEALGSTLHPGLGDVDALSPPCSSVLKFTALEERSVLSITPPSMDDLPVNSFTPLDSIKCILDVPSWKSTIDQLMSQTPVPSIAIMGSKGAGKSTFTRYCVNRLLKDHDRVCYIDTDIGQPEFTAPGLVSLTVITRPLLYTEGAYSFLLKTFEVQYSYFIGAATPAESPLLYIDAMRKLMQRAAEFAGCPVVMNTMGWVVGVGLHMVNTLCDLAQISVVVRLGDFPEPENDANVFFDYFDVEECPREEIDIRNDVQIRRNTMQPFELRWIRFFIHFRPDIRTLDRQGLPLASFFARCTAHRLQRSSLVFCFSEAVEPSDIEAALVGVIVAVAEDCGIKDCSVIEAAHEIVSYAFVHSVGEEVVLYTPFGCELEDKKYMLLRGPLTWTPTKRVDDVEPYSCAFCLTGLSTGSKVSSTRVIPRKRILGET